MYNSDDLSKFRRGLCYFDPPIFSTPTSFAICRVAGNAADSGFFIAVQLSVHLCCSQLVPSLLVSRPVPLVS